MVPAAARALFCHSRHLCKEAFAQQQQQQRYHGKPRGTKKKIAGKPRSTDTHNGPKVRTLADSGKDAEERAL